MILLDQDGWTFTADQSQRNHLTTAQIRARIHACLYCVVVLVGFAAGVLAAGLWR